MKKNITVYLSNISEDVWPFISQLSPAAFTAEVEENACLSDRALFTLSDNTVFISPKPVSTQFLSYFKKLSNFKNIEILVPRHANGQLSLDTIADTQLMDHLVSLKDIDLLSYSATPEFYQLYTALSQRGVSINLPISPSPEKAGTVDQFGSKSGIRTVIDSLHHPQVFMAPGKIFPPHDSSFMDYAVLKIKSGRGIVIKTNRGHAGMGVLILPPGRIDPQANIPNQINRCLDSESYWHKFPLIVEDFIAVDHAISGGFPNIEYRIESDGRITQLYPCGMNVSSEGVFRGVEIGPDAIPSPILARLETIGQILGRHYASAGYRGHYEFDFAAGLDGRLYVTESNLRQTGGTHVYRLARHLLGPDFISHHYLIANNNYPLGSKEYKFSDIIELFKPILFSPFTCQGVIISSENMLSFGRLSYVAIAPSKNATQALVARLESLLQAIVVKQK